jgi:hypothetical protein
MISSIQFIDITRIFLLAFRDDSSRLGRNAGELDPREDIAVDRVAEAVDTNMLFARPVFFRTAGRKIKS